MSINNLQNSPNFDVVVGDIECNDLSASQVYLENVVNSSFPTTFINASAILLASQMVSGNVIVGGSGSSTNITLTLDSAVNIYNAIGNLINNSTPPVGTSISFYLYGNVSGAYTGNITLSTPSGVSISVSTVQGGTTFTAIQLGQRKVNLIVAGVNSIQVYL